MKYSEAEHGRVFVIRLEHGDIVHETIERFAREKSIRAAALIALGGADTGGKLVVGPETADARPIQPMSHLLNGVHEVAGTGTLFPDENGDPVLHMHMACGRKNTTATGCIRQGVKTWQVMEVVLLELTECNATRAYEPELGFNTLQP